MWFNCESKLFSCMGFGKLLWLKLSTILYSLTSQVSCKMILMMRVTILLLHKINHQACGFLFFIFSLQL